MLKFHRETEFKETEIGKVPREWSVKELGWAVRSLESGNRPKGGFLKHDPNGVLSIGGENITWEADLILDECLRFSEDFYNSLKRGKIKEKDILLVKDGATIGKLAFIKNIPEGKAMVNEHVFLIRTEEPKYYPRFLFYFLFSEAGQIQIENSIGGSAQGGINRSILETIKIPKIDLHEQFRIATVLSWFDDLIENKRRQNEILEKTAIAIFKSWFVDFEPFKDEKFVYNEKLGRKIPKEWGVRKLGEVVRPIKGKKCKIFEEPLRDSNPYLLIESFKGLETNFWTKEKHPFVDELDIVLVADGESSGRVLRYRSGIIGSTLLMLRPKSDVFNFDLRNYTYLYLKTIEDEIMEHRTGSAIPHLDKDFLKELEVIIPHQPILQKFHSLVEPLFQKIILNQKQIMLLRKIRNALLPELVFGKIRVVEI